MSSCELGGTGDSGAFSVITGGWGRRLLRLPSKLPFSVALAGEAEALKMRDTSLKCAPKSIFMALGILSLKA
jgi:hypothetical protein